MQMLHVDVFTIKSNLIANYSKYGESNLKHLLLPHLNSILLLILLYSFGWWLFPRDFDVYFYRCWIPHIILWYGLGIVWCAPCSSNFCFTHTSYYSLLITHHCDMIWQWKNIKERLAHTLHNTPWEFIFFFFWALFSPESPSSFYPVIIVIAALVYNP